MELFVVFVAVLALGFPVISVVALVRSGKNRDLLERSNLEYRRELDFLRRTVEQLQRDLKQLSERKDRAPDLAMPAASAPANVVAPLPQAVAPVQPGRPGPVQPPLMVKPAHDVPAPFAAPAVPSVTLSYRPETPHVPAKKEATIREAVAGKPPLYQPYRQSAPVAAAVAPEAAPRKSFRQRLQATLPLEELLGMNLFARIGIVLLVLGFALLGRMALLSMGPGQRVALIYAVSAAMLSAGIWLEKKERYRLLGRAGIGGGWALLFFTSYAVHHVAAMAVLASSTADCILMLAVAIGMVAHTLRYKSQVVTGLAFLLAFSTVALSQNSVYALSSGVILALGIAAIGLRMRWYELEVFGILATYANHFYWLYRLYPSGFAGQSFPQFWPSVVILLLYWSVFRASYVVRSIPSHRQESVSSAAALLNTIALLAVMKFQSTRPELAFYALLGLGIVEFVLAQIPLTRRRRVAFKLLTIMGVVLVFASVPFKFSGNNIALFWMIAAELLLAAGILQPEIVFQRLGSIAGALTGCLILFEARHIFAFRQHSQAPLVHNGVLLFTASLLFCSNSYFVRRRWPQLFQGLDSTLAAVQGYLGAATAFLAVWALFSSELTVLGWAALFLAACAGKRYLNDNHMLAQAWVFAAIVLFRCENVNCHFDIVYPHHLAARVVTMLLIAAACYAAAWILSGRSDARVPLRTLSLWSGALLIAELIWLEVSQPWIALVWVAFAVALLLTARRLGLGELTHQQHALAVAALVQLIAVNLGATSSIERYIPLLGCAAAFYTVSRFSTFKDAFHRRFSGWAYTSIATGLVAALAWHESPQPWLAAIWAGIALALALVDRIFSVEELPWQAHVLALLAVMRAATINLYLNDAWRGVHLRLITVGMVIACLYGLARWVRFPQWLSDADARHVYTWIAAGLAAWLVWTELPPVAVAVGWAIFGLVLFEIASWKNQPKLRWQAFVALAGSFVRIFFVNLMAKALPGEQISARSYTVVALALLYFYIWSRLPRSTRADDAGRWNPADLLAHAGTASLAALLLFEMAPAWVIVAWAILGLVLMIAAWLSNRRVLLAQSHVLVAAVVIRSLAHNLFGTTYFAAGEWHGRSSILSITAALLMSGLPIAFQLRARYRGQAVSMLDRALAVCHPQQVFFFAPVLLATLTIAVKMNPGAVTLSFGIEGVLVIFLGLLASQRSYRLTGLLLLLLCVAKIAVHDAWLLGERDRYTTFIALGAALTLVSLLYGRYRETLRRLL
jgi:hypothetical protein